MEKVTRREFFGETLGTFILVFFGLGSVAVEVATSVTLELPLISLIWGAAAVLAIYICSPLSGAHINSAMTLAFAAWTDFPWRKVPAYIAAQFLGAILGALAVYACFSGAIADFERAQEIIRGEPGSEVSAKIFGEYFGQAPLLKAVIWEGAGTFLLAFGVFWLISFTKRYRCQKLLPVMIGIWLALLIWLVAPVTQAGFNPARDLGPRLMSSFLGWGSWTFNANEWGWLLVYVCAPILGALLGGLFLRGEKNLIRRGLAVLLGFSFVWFGVVRLTSSLRKVEIEGSLFDVSLSPKNGIKIGCYNIAHGRGHELCKSNWDGGDKAERRQRLEKLAELMKSENLDVIILNEVDFNCSWSHGVDQATALADLLEMPYIARQRNLDTGLPFFSWEFGNAILSRYPLKNVELVSYPLVRWWEPILVGQKNGLKVTAVIGEEEIDFVAVHLETRDAGVRMESVRRLQEIRGENLVLAGDFNSSISESGSSAIDYLRDTQRFTSAGGWDDPEGVFFTYPAPNGGCRIDWILAPKGWRSGTNNVHPAIFSDHALVVSRWNYPK